MSNGHNFYMDMGENATVVHGIPDLAVGRNNVSGSDVYLEVSGRGIDHFTAVDANELRDAIDRAVGPREKADGQAAIDYAADSWYEIKNHDFFDDCYDLDSIARHKIIKKLDRIQTHQGYSAKQRTAHLNHIADVEAALTRRNEQRLVHEARIRELEAEVHTLREIKDSYEEPKTTREYLQMAWDVAVVPEDGEIHRGEAFLARGKGETITGAIWDRDIPAQWRDYEHRLLDPRVEPTTAEKRRAEYEAQGLKDWEIELLMEANVA